MKPFFDSSDDGNVRCPICYEDLGQTDREGSGELGIVLPCGHCVGHHCLRQAVEHSGPQGPCPSCRAQLSVEHRTAILRMTNTVPSTDHAVRRARHDRASTATRLREAFGLQVQREQATSRVRADNIQIDIGNMTTDELPPLLRIYHPHTSLFRIIQRLHTNDFSRAAQEMRPWLPFHPLEHDSLAMRTISSLYTDEEIQELARISHSDQRGYIPARIASYFSNFNYIAARMGGAREGAPNLYFETSPEIEQMVRILLRPTSRAVGRRQQFTLNQSLARMLNLQVIGDQEDTVAELSRESSSTSDEASEAIAEQDGAEVDVLDSMLRPSLAHRTALRFVVEHLDSSAFGVANLLNNDPNTEGPSPPNDPATIRRLYTPAEIEALYEIIELDWPHASNGSQSRGTVAHLLESQATEQTASLRARLDELILRPTLRNIMFNGDTTLAHGISPLAGGVSHRLGATNLLDDATTERNRIGETPVGLFLRAATSKLAFPFEDHELMDYSPIEGSGMTLAEIAQSYTNRELDELHGLLSALYGSGPDHNGSQSVKHYDGDFYRDTDERAGYRLRVEEILYRPVARARETEEQRRLDETRRSARTTSRGPALGEAGASYQGGSNTMEAGQSSNAGLSSRYHVRTRPVVDGFAVRQAGPDASTPLVATSERPRTYAGEDGQADITYHPRSGRFTIDEPQVVTFPGIMQHTYQPRRILPEPELVDEDPLPSGHAALPARRPMTWAFQVFGEEAHVAAIQEPAAVSRYGPEPYRISLKTITLRAFGQSLLQPTLYNERTIRPDDPDLFRASIRFILDIFTDQDRERMWILMNSLCPYRDYATNGRSRDDLSVGDFVRVARRLESEQAADFLELVQTTQAVIDELTLDAHTESSQGYEGATASTTEIIRPRTSAHWGGPWQPRRGGAFRRDGGPPPYHGYPASRYFQAPTYRCQAAQPYAGQTEQREPNTTVQGAEDTDAGPSTQPEVAPAIPPTEVLRCLTFHAIRLAANPHRSSGVPGLSAQITFTRRYFEPREIQAMHELMHRLYYHLGDEPGVEDQRTLGEYEELVMDRMGMDHERFSEGNMLLRLLSRVERRLPGYHGDGGCPPM